MMDQAGGEMAKREAYYDDVMFPRSRHNEQLRRYIMSRIESAYEWVYFQIQDSRVINLIQSTRKQETFKLIY